MKTRIQWKKLRAANIPRMDATDFNAKINDDCTELERAEATVAMAKLSDYLKIFARVPNGLCLGCGSRLGATDVVDAFLNDATFMWSIAHGEGFYRKCGYPGRALHYVNGDAFKFQRILQYHPDELKAEP